MSLAIAGYMPWLPLRALPPLPTATRLPDRFGDRRASYVEAPEADVIGKDHGRDGVLRALERTAVPGQGAAYRCRCNACGREVVRLARDLAKVVACSKVCARFTRVRAAKGGSW